MKNLVLASIFLTSSAIAKEDIFKKEATSLAKSLRESLVRELSKKIAEGGPLTAIPFCHDNVKAIAKEAAKGQMDKYEFGRTSHKIRNPGNAPKDWMNSYLEQFKGTKQEQGKDKSFVHLLPDGKRVYLEPLYVGPLCLNCHGPAVAQNIQSKIKELYPDDKATGFAAGEFRGFLWVKQK